MVAEGVHSPQDEVEAEREPRERDPVAHRDVAEHPSDLRPTEPPIRWVLVEIDLVVPLDESVPQRRHEDEERDERERRWDAQWRQQVGGERAGKHAQRVVDGPRRRPARNLDAVNPGHGLPLTPWTA